MLLRVPLNIFLFTGKTGVGKSRLLRYLSSLHEPVLDLETIARHSGSAFGANGKQQAQPDASTFQKQIGEVLEKAQQHGYVFTEQKGRNIGSRKLSADTERMLEHAHCINITASEALRIAHLEEDYFSHPTAVEDAIQSLAKMKHNMPPPLWIEANNYLVQKRIPEFLNTMLHYYDETIIYKRDETAQWHIHLSSDDDIPNAIHSLLEWKTTVMNHHR